MIAKSDHVSFYEPKVGALFLWPAWMLLMAIGLTRQSLWRMPAAAGILGAGVSALLMLSYPTTTLRYHVDLWPVIALSAVFGIAYLAHSVGEGRHRFVAWQAVMGALVVAGVVVSLHKTLHSHVMNLEPAGAWSEEYCLELTAKKGFSADRSREICELRPDGSEA